MSENNNLNRQDSLVAISNELGEELLGQEILEKYVFHCDRGYKRHKSIRKHRNPYKSKKTGCPAEIYVTRFKKEPEKLYMFQTEAHTNHGSEDPRYDPLPDRIRQICVDQTIFGATPCKMLAALRENKEHFGLTEDEIQGVTPGKLSRLQQQIRKEQQLDPNERMSIRKMKAMPEFHILSLCEEKGRYEIVICSDFQASMLRKFGGFVFVDSVHKVTNHGLFQLMMLIVDETGSGVPVGFC